MAKITAPKILIIDDDEDDNILLGDLLCDAFAIGKRPDWADTFEGGLSALVDGEYDICLVDYLLGQRDGLELVRQALLRGCRAPIILLTGQECRQTDLDALAAGAVDYLVKGEITASQLERTIRYAIERKRVEERLERLGFEDPLTGLSNRTLFHNRLEQTIKLADREDRPFAVVMMDLDGFKAVNDTFGDAAGDAVLVEIARRAKAILRASDTIARIGGDEIAAVMPTASTIEAAIAMAERLVDITNRPVVLDECEARVGLSVGIAFYPHDGTDLDSVLKRADEAMYQAKRTGTGFAIAGDGERAKSIDSAMLAGGLPKAIELGQLDIHHQPIIDLQTETVWGVEALARWHHPDRGCLTPAAFVEAAERTASIEPMTIATLSKALEHAVGFHAAGHDLSLAVNLSTHAFRNDALPDMIEKTLADSGFPPEKLSLEISESGLVADFDRSAAMLKKIAATGVSIAIDDFGAGLSTFGKLKELPITEIKIHGSLIRNLATDDADLAIVRSIISLCEDLGLRTVAEAVETRSELHRLTELGCQLAQGYCLAHPMPADQLCDWADTWSMPRSIGLAASR